MQTTYPVDQWDRVIVVRPRKSIIQRRLRRTDVKSCSVRPPRRPPLRRQRTLHPERNPAARTAGFLGRRTFGRYLPRLIEICLGLASSRLGKVSCNTPSLYSALMLFWSTTLVRE